MGEILGGFPGEVGIVSTEVTAGSSLLVDGSLEVEFLDDHTRSQIEVVGDDFLEIQIRVAFSSSVIRVDVDGEGLSNTNTVSNLDEGSLAETSMDEGLGDPSGSVGSRSVNLSGVLTGESTTTVTTPTTVGVDDDLSTS